MRKCVWLAAIFLVGLVFPAAAYVLPCEACSCGHSCTQSCDVTSTCGAYGVCQGTPGCGGGCLTVGEADRFRELMRGFQDAVTASEERGEVTARLTWRLAQYVEESGLGTVFTGGTRFHLPGRVQTPALAFMHAGKSKDSNPDLVVEFVTKPGHDAAVAAWLSAGVKAVLSVDPAARSVAVYQGQDVRILDEAGYLEFPDTLPGWSLRVGELFK
jgi:hypothetical protein